MTKGGVSHDGSDLVVSFGRGVAAEFVDAVVDVDADGTVLGIEGPSCSRSTRV
jgi:hypothetical protein